MAGQRENKNKFVGNKLEHFYFIFKLKKESVLLNNWLSGRCKSNYIRPKIASVHPPIMIGIQSKGKKEKWPINKVKRNQFTIVCLIVRMFKLTSMIIPCLLLNCAFSNPLDSNEGSSEEISFYELEEFRIFETIV